MITTVIDLPREIFQEDKHLVGRNQPTFVFNSYALTLLHKLLWCIPEDITRHAKFHMKATVFFILAFSQA